VKIGMNLFLWGATIGPAHYPLLRELKALGYDGVEVPVFPGTNFRELGTVLADLGLGALACTVMTAETNPISADPTVRAKAREQLLRVLDSCAEMQAEIVCGPLHSALGVFSGSGPTDAEREHGIAFFREMAPAAAQRQVTLALEYLNRFENYFLTTARDTFSLVEAVDHPACGMMWDTFHAHIEEKSAAPVAEIRSRLVHVHISENDRGTPGTGQVHWAENFQALRAIGYDRWMVIEAFGRSLPELAAATRVWRDLFGDPLQLSAEGLRFIQKSWAAAA
jgi:D-psicose/D-tagatose/L-ribulose 3-epimerase